MTEHHRAPEPTPDRTADLSPGRERTIDVPGTTIAYCVIGDLASVTAERPPLMLFGSPMDRTGFGSLAARLPGRVLVLVDSRNTGRSVRADPTAAVRVDEHAADLHAVPRIEEEREIVGAERSGTGSRRVRRDGQRDMEVVLHPGVGARHDVRRGHARQRRATVSLHSAATDLRGEGSGSMGLIRGWR